MLFLRNFRIERSHPVQLPTIIKPGSAAFCFFATTAARLKVLVTSSCILEKPLNLVQEAFEVGGHALRGGCRHARTVSDVEIICPNGALLKLNANLWNSDAPRTWRHVSTPASRAIKGVKTRVNASKRGGALRHEWTCLRSQSPVLKAKHVSLARHSWSSSADRGRASKSKPLPACRFATHRAGEGQ